MVRSNRSGHGPQLNDYQPTDSNQNTATTIACLCASTAILAGIAIYQRSQLNQYSHSSSPETTPTTGSATTDETNNGDETKLADEPKSDASNSHKPPEPDAEKPSDDTTVKSIGTVSSIYKLCVGTPRQGMLVPTSRARITLHQTLSPDILLGLEGYSHIYVLFLFHLNTKGGNRKNTPSKISPPALGGTKVGVFSTRSPHRPNNVGFSLVKLDNIEIRNKKLGNKGTVIHVSGIDLVDGTPVLDIKPYVPHYDTVNNMTPTLDDNTAPTAPPISTVTVPEWVSSGLTKRRTVTLTSTATSQLRTLVSENKCEFYTSDEYTEVLECITNVIAVDVRSVWQSQKARNGKFQAERALGIDNIENESSDVDGDNKTYCTQQIDNLLIYYTSKANQSDDNDNLVELGSGAGDEVEILKIEEISWQQKQQQMTAKKPTERTKKSSKKKRPDSKPTSEPSETFTSIAGMDKNDTLDDTPVASEEQNDTLDDDTPVASEERNDNSSPVVINEEQEIDNSSQLPAAQDADANIDKTNYFDTKREEDGEEEFGTYELLSSTTDDDDVVNVTPPVTKDADESPETQDVDNTTPEPTKIDTPSTEDADAPKESEYGSLKSFWSKASIQNTPAGLTPASAEEKMAKDKRETKTQPKQIKFSSNSSGSRSSFSVSPSKSIKPPPATP